MRYLSCVLISSVSIYISMVIKSAISTSAVLTIYEVNVMATTHTVCGLVKLDMVDLMELAVQWWHSTQRKVSIHTMSIK